MSIKEYSKGNPKWVREGRGNKTGKFHWEYRINGKYYAEGFYKTAQEAYEACLKHQEWIDKWTNPEKLKGELIYG